MKAADYAAELAKRCEAVGWKPHYNGGPFTAFLRPGQGWIRVQLVGGLRPAVSYSQWMPEQTQSIVRHWIAELGDGPLDADPPIPQPEPPPRYRSEWE